MNHKNELFRGLWVAPTPVPKSLEEFVPAYLLRGLIPASLLQSHDFWQNTGPSCRSAGFLLQLNFNFTSISTSHESYSSIKYCYCTILMITIVVAG